MLQLSTDERHTLWRAAVGSARPAASFATGRDRGLARMVDALPYPAYVTDAAWRVLAANRAVAQWFVDFGSLPAADRNIGKWISGTPTHGMFSSVGTISPTNSSLGYGPYATLGDVPAFASWLTEMRGYPDFESRWTTDAEINIDPATVRRYLSPADRPAPGCPSTW
ncbi:transcriptional regulator [Salinispora arenicola]|uniref:MmyB family transcriptional regulator n=1 Tax=Salinispora arenicola TaxID=168697 RepID=UPI001E5A071A|nr:transcriptional regulator [Salinispora arenicola]